MEQSLQKICDFLNSKILLANKIVDQHKELIWMAACLGSYFLGFSTSIIFPVFLIAFISIAITLMENFGFQVIDDQES